MYNVYVIIICVYNNININNNNNVMCINNV